MCRYVHKVSRFCWNSYCCNWILWDRAEMVYPVEFFSRCIIYWLTFKRLSSLIERFDSHRMAEVKIIDVCKTRIQMIFVGYNSWLVMHIQLLDYHCQSHAIAFGLILFSFAWLSLVLSSSISAIRVRAGVCVCFFQFVHNAVLVLHINKHRDPLHRNNELCIFMRPNEREPT